MKNKWYQSPFTIIILLVIFAPAGIFFLWKYASWKPRTKWILTAVSLFMFFSLANGSKKPTSSDAIVPRPTEAQVEVQYVFDTPSLVGKNIDEVRTVLGEPEDGALIEPSEEQKKGTKQWDNTFKKNGNELLVTYNSETRKIIDFFISTDNPSGQTQDKEHLLELGNLQYDDTRYTVEFVKVLKNPSHFTGIKVSPR